MSLERFCRTPVVSMLPTQSVHDAAITMRDHHVGAVLVVDNERPVGIVTDRDIVMRAIAEGRDPHGTPVSAIMSRNVTTVRRTDKIDDAVSAIRVAGVRRVPIVDADGRPIGMITMDDLVVLMAGELSAAAGAVQENRGS